MSEPQETPETEEEKPRKKGCGCFVVFLVCISTFLVVIYLFIFQFRIFAQPIAIESFDRTKDSGWLVLGDAQGESELPTLKESGGHPGGYMEAIDDAVGGVWYWAAPESFRQSVTDHWKNNGSRLGAQLSFDLKQSALDKNFEADDVILSDGTTSLGYQHKSPPGIEWTSYTIPLKASQGWTNSDTGKPATAEEMKQVLSQLEKLWIRGEFRTGVDTGGIDNIVVR